ncbi:MAG: hypothetical protein SGJ24_17760 [Chloroflexota bacterium]|nr:hypothetical protein [Chloroflexota bacterium]
MLKKLLLLIVCLMLIVVPAWAQGDDVRIEFPPPVYDLAGAFGVVGTVNPAGLNTYFFELGAYPDAGGVWTPVSLPSRTPVTNATLATIDSRLVADGLYTLRLRVLLTDGSSRTVEVAPLRVANTLIRLDGSTPPSLGGAPVAPAQPATPEPPRLVARPTIINSLPIPVGGQMDNFDEDAATLMTATGMTWMKWQIPFVVGDTSLITVARDRVNWSHERGFLALLSVKGTKEELEAGGIEYYEQYAAFVGELARLQPSAIQVWNEMNIDREWPTGQIDPRAYVELLRAAHEAIKAVDPSIKVITGAPAPTGAEGAFGLERVWNDDRYYLGMANAGAASFADCIGIHYNEGIISPRLQGGDPRGTYETYYLPLMLQRAAFPFRATAVPLCFSELGYLSPDGYGTLPAGFAWGQNTSVAEQAEWLRDAIDVAAASGNVDLLIVFNVNFTRFVDGDPQGGFAIIRPDGTCPACDQIATLRGGG